MPKRILDGEAYWLSEKVKQLPKEYRLHYAVWIPLAEANGVFEANPSQIYTRVYSFLRPDFSVEDVRKLLDAMVRVGLVQIWKQDGKTWGYFIGIDKEGRLPSAKHLETRYKNLPPAPPVDIRPKHAARLIYFIQQGGTNYVKIGSTGSKKSLKSRMEMLQNGSPAQLKLLGVMEETPSRGETDIQKLFSGARKNREWFNLTDELAQFIKQNAALTLDFIPDCPG